MYDHQSSSCPYGLVERFDQRGKESVRAAAREKLHSYRVSLNVATPSARERKESMKENTKKAIERQRDRERETAIERQRDRERETEKNRERQRKRERERERRRRDRETTGPSLYLVSASHSRMTYAPVQVEFSESSSIQLDRFERRISFASFARDSF
jgi:hypothetical protein